MVLIQLGVERKTNDVATFYFRSHSNLTPYSKIFKETHLIRNVREIYFEKQGWIQQNNINILATRNKDDLFHKVDIDSDDEEESTFKGAINAEPRWNAKIGLPILGEKSNNVFRNVIDYDMGAFYPSIKIACNMDPSTLLWKAEFHNEEFISGEFSNKSLNQIYQEKNKNGKMVNLDITGEAVNTYVGKNILTFGYQYMNLPSITELQQLIEQKLK